MAEEHTTSSGLLGWLLGGIVVGGVLLGLLVAAYEIGYHRGEDHGRAAAATVPAATVTTPTTPTATTPAPGGASLATGRKLYTGYGCVACHTLDGSASAGPTFKGLAGSTVTLTTGQTVTADDRYLDESIRNPDAQISKGYRAGVMPAAIAGFDLAAKPQAVAALVAFIKAQK